MDISEMNRWTRVRFRDTLRHSLGESNCILPRWQIRAVGWRQTVMLHVRRVRCMLSMQIEIVLVSVDASRAQVEWHWLLAPA